MTTPTHRQTESRRIATLRGTPAEVRSQLASSDAEQVVVLVFENQKASVAYAIAETLVGAVPFVSDLIQKRQRETLEKVVDALVPVAPVAPHLLAEARMTAKARTALLESGDWLTSAQIADLAGFSAVNPSAQPNRWKKGRLIFAVSHHGTDLFPAYGLDPDANYRPLVALAEVLAIFNGRKDAWGLAYWFASVNGFLGGKRPQDLLRKTPKRVLEAARDEIAEIAHG